MKFNISFEHMPEYVLVQTDGKASVQEFDALLKQLVDAPRWETGTKQLVDHRELKLDHLTIDDMHAIKDVVERYGRKLGKGRCAFVVDNAVGFGISRMYELVGGEGIHGEVGVFYSIDDAAEWLHKQE